MVKYWAEIGAASDTCRPEYNIAGKNLVYRASEVEEELVVQYKKGYDSAHRDYEQNIRADERERIRKEYKRLRSNHMAADAAEIAMGEGKSTGVSPIIEAMQKVQDIFSKAIEEVRKQK